MAQPSNNSNRRDATIGWVLLIVIIVGSASLIFYSTPCSGFSACTTTSQIVSETNGNITTTTTVETQPAKTFWDLLQLAGIPLALVGLAWWLNSSEQQRQTALSLDQMREERFQTYFARMTNLLEKGPRTLPLDPKKRSIARTLTLTTLRGLDGERKGLLVRFLNESGMIDKNNLFRPPSQPVNYETGASPRDANPNIFIPEFKFDSKPDAALEDEFRRAAQDDFKQNPLISLANADLTNANLRGSKMWYVDLSNADLSGADLHSANLFGSNLSGTTLNGADLSGADLSAVYLSGANLSNANLVKASLAGAFVNAETGAESYESTEIARGDTRPITNLSGADLSNANLSGADLSGKTDLSNANLVGAILNNVVLSGANLYLAKISDEQLAQVESLMGATMPDGSCRDY
jgi:uncharacterized protein YjbI with pentapeptide repeats